jgi:hypothetical protein
MHDSRPRVVVAREQQMTYFVRCHDTDNEFKRGSSFSVLNNLF